MYGASDAPLGAGSVKIPKSTPKTAFFVINRAPHLYISAGKPEETLSLSAYLSHSRKIRQNPKNFIFCKPRVPPNYERKAPVRGPMASLWRGYRDAAGGLCIWCRVLWDPRHGDPGPGQDVAQQRLARLRWLWSAHAPLGLRPTAESHAKSPPTRADPVPVRVQLARGTAC